MTAWLPLLLLLPFREGSGSPEGLLLAHLALLFGAAFSSSAARRVSGSLLAASVAVLLLASLSGALGPYHYASLLAIVDLGAMLAVLVLVEAKATLASGVSSEILLDAVAFSGLAQAGLVLTAWIASGFHNSGPGTLLNPDHAAAYLLLAFWALVARGARTRGEAIARTVGGAFLLGATLLQASRGGFLALAAGGSIWLALRLRALSPRMARATFAAVGVVALLGTLAIAHRFATREDPYRWDRLRLWRAALQVASGAPLLGVGPGIFGDVSAPWDLAHDEAPVRFGKHIEATHSDPMRIFAETGVLGLAAFALLAIAVAAPCVRAIRRGGGTEVALAAALGGALAQAMVENLSARPAVSYTGAALAALLAARGRKCHEVRYGRTPLPGEEPASVAAPRPLGTLSASQDVPSSLSRSASSTATEEAAQTVLEAPVNPEPRSPGGSPSSVDRPGKFWPVFGTLYFGGLASASIVLVIAPYLGHHAFLRFHAGDRTWARAMQPPCSGRRSTLTTARP